MIGELGASLIGPYTVTLVAYPVLNMTVGVASGSNFIHVYKEGTAGCGENYVLMIGELSSGLVLPYLITVGAVPVLNIAERVASGSYSVYVNNVAAKLGNNYVLNVGNLSASRISPYALTLVADPVLNVTDVVASGSNSLNVSEEGAAGCGANNVLMVGELSSSLVLPNLLALCTVPVLDVTERVTAGSYSVDVNNLTAKLGNNYVLVVGELGASLIGPYALTLVADPVLNVTGVVASGSYSVDVSEEGAAGCGENNVLMVGELSSGLVLPYLLALCAVPILDVTDRVTAGSYSVDVNNIAAKLGDNYVLTVGKLSSGLIGPNLLTLVAGPVLIVTGIVASGSYSVHVNNVTAKLGENYVFNVGKLCASLVGPNLLTLIADPVLNVTDVVARGSNCLDVSEEGATCCGNYNVLNVGNLSASLISPNALTVVAYPVLNGTGVVTAGSNCFHMYEVGVSRGDQNGESVEVCSGELLVIPAGSAVLTCPVLNVTGHVAGSLNSVKVKDGMLSLRSCVITTVHTVLIALV